MCFVGLFLFSPVHKKEQRLWFSVVFYEVSIGLSHARVSGACFCVFCFVLFCVCLFDFFAH